MISRDGHRDPRVFLGHSAPTLELAARQLLPGTAAGEERDLTRTLVVLPTARAGRMLQAMLLERAEALGAGVWPPEVCRPDDAVDRLLGERLSAVAAAGRVGIVLAWRDAIMALSMDDRSALGWTERIDAHAWADATAARLIALSAELARYGLRLHQVAEREDVIPFHEDRQRWAAAARAQSFAERVLLQHSPHGPSAEPDLRRLDAVRGGDGFPLLPGIDRVVLIACDELSGIAAEAFRCTPVPVEPWIAASADDSAAFDELGRPRTEEWRDRRPDLPDHLLEFASDPADQAARVLAAAAALGAGRNTDEVSIGTPDPQVLARVERAAQRTPRVRVRSITGRLASATRPGRLLALVAAAVERPSVERLVALVSHESIEPEMEALAGPRWLDGVHGVLAGHPLSPLDLRQPPFPAASDSGQRAVNALAEIARDALGPIPATDEALSCERLAAWIAQVVERASTEGPEHDHADARAAAVFRSACDELAAEAERRLMPLDALGLVIDAVGSTPCPPAEDAAAVELLGWFEMPLDPAPRIVLAGLDEGSVPPAARPDPMLPEAMRRAIGLPTQEDRLALESFRLHATLSGREAVAIISGLRDASGAPVWPSRLLLGRTGDEQASRVARLVAGPSDPAWLLVSRLDTQPAETDPFDLWVAQGIPGVEFEIPRVLPVTALKEYLASPRAFFLTRVLRLASSEQASPELSPLSFGILIHESIARFARSTARDSTDIRQIESSLLDAFATEWGARLPGPPRPAVRLQRVIAETRLRAWAVREAERRRAGWCIEHTELDLPGGSLLVDEKPMGFRARIDRIERNEQDGRVLVLDFKTGEAGDGPEQTHRRADRWTDFQLPMYAHLFAQHSGLPPGQIDVGYGLLGRDTEAVRVARAEWDEADHASCLDAAAEIVRAIRRGEFDDPGDAAGYDDPIAAMCALSAARASAGAHE